MHKVTTRSVQDGAYLRMEHYLPILALCQFFCVEEAICADIP